MGLDMYLERIHRNADGYRNVNLDDFDVNSKLYKTLAPYFHQRGSEFYSWTSLFEEVGYWRKANAIHKWFVENVQNGEDDCGQYEVSKEQLEELLDVCKEVLDKVVMAPSKIANLIMGRRVTKNGCEDIPEDKMTVLNPEVCEELLPTQCGFFFGSTNYDEFYIDDIKETVSILTKVLEETNFDEYKIYYSSSW